MYAHSSIDKIYMNMINTWNEEEKEEEEEEEEEEFKNSKIMYHPKHRVCRRYLYAGCTSPQW